MKSIKIIAASVSLSYSFSALAQISNDTLAQFLVKASEQGKNTRYIPLTKNASGIQLLLAADSLAQVKNNITAQATINEELGHYYYMQDPDKCIEYNRKAYMLFSNAENKKRAAQCLHNIAFAYDEQKNDISNAIKYTRLAIRERTELKDTLSMANMYKYLGLLQGRTHSFNDAKENEAEAIRLFTLKNYMRGVAVCYRDLAIAYEEVHMPDSCIAYVILAENIWNGYNDTSRLFNANNILLRVYTSENKLQEAGTVFLKNNSMVNSKAIQDMRRSYSDILDYYKISQTYFNKKKNDKMAKEYLAKYDAYKETAKQQGYNVD